MSLIDSIDVGFDCKVSRTQRVNLVFDAFGLDIDNYQHKIVDGLTLPSKWDIMYITGISGSGKTTLLRAISEKYGHQFNKYSMSTMYKELRKSDRPVIDSIFPDSFERALSSLNSVGLSEAFVYFKLFRELSEGQKYRFYLAKLLEMSDDMVIVDEFTSMLDRITAGIVAYNYQKAVRRERKRLVVATSHDDLTDTLRPSHRIVFNYSGEHHISRVEPQNNRPPFIDEMECVRLTHKSDLGLLKYHYKNVKLPAMVTDIFGMMFRGSIVGLIVYSVPIRSPMLSSFNLTEGESDKFERLSTNEKRLLSGSNTCIISRVVIHPTFRGIGLGAHILTETIPLVNKRIVLISSVMSNYVSFCESAGMTLIEPKSAVKFDNLTKFFDKHDIDANRLYYDNDYRRDVIRDIRKDSSLFAEFVKLIEHYIKKYFVGLGYRGVEESKKILSDSSLEKYILKLRPTKVKTFYKENPHIPIDFSSVNKFRGKLFTKKSIVIERQRLSKGG